MSLFLAVLPLLVVIAALLARQSTTRSAALGLLAAIFPAVLWFQLSLGETIAAGRQWWPLIVEVMLIIFGGIAFAEAGKRTGDQAALSGWLRSRLGTGVAPALAVTHGVTPLAESLTGFGIGVVIAIPLLLGLGFPGRKAAIIGLLGLCAAPWGAMGPGMLIASRFAETSFLEFGVYSALISLPVFLGAGIAAALVVTRDRLLSTLALALGSGLVLWVSILGANLLFGTAPAGAVGAALTLGVHLLIHRLRGVNLRMSRRQLTALAPYAVLLGAVLAASVTLQITGHTESNWHYLASPALWLAVSTLFALRRHRREIRPTLHGGVLTWLHVGPANAMFICIGVLMAESGMSGQIAVALAGLGSFYLFLVPVVGGTGGFITGSGTGANAMFAAPQAEAAAALGVSALPVTASQNVSAALLGMASPSRVELAVRLCPEGTARLPVFRTVLLCDVLLIAVLGVLTAVLAG